MPNEKLSVFKFSTESGNQYLFDNAMGIVIPCSDSMYYIISNYSTYDKKHIISELTSKYKLEAYEAEMEYQYVGKMIKTGHFYKQNPEHPTHTINHQEALLTTTSSQLILILTENCNIRCKYCVFSDNYPNIKSYTDKRMDFDTAKKAVDYYMVLHKKRQEKGLKKDAIISFYGGEPLLEFELIKQVVHYCKNRNDTATFYITTNGTIMNEEIIDFIIDNNIIVTFSVDGDQLQHDRNRVFEDNRGTFDLVMKNITALQKEKQKRNIQQLITFNCCYDSYSDMVRTLDFFENHRELFEPFHINYGEINKYDTIYYDYCNEMHEKGKLPGDKNNLAHSMNTLRAQFIEEITNEKKPTNVMNALFLGLIFFKHRAKGKYPMLNNTCVSGSKIAVAPDGSFYICERMNQRCPIGNVEDKIDWEKVDKILNTYLDILNNKCKDCSFSRMCDVCYLHLVKNDDLAFNEQFCSDKQIAIPKLLKTLYSILELNPNALDDLFETTNMNFYEVMNK